MQSRFEALRGHRDDYKLYVRFDPTLNGNGGGGRRTGNGGAGQRHASRAVTATRCSSAPTP